MAHRPVEWATRAVNAYKEFRADLIVAEKNQGGDMVASTLKNVAPAVPVQLVHASRGKRTRAELIVCLDGDETKMTATTVETILEELGSSDIPHLELPDTSQKFNIEALSLKGRLYKDRYQGTENAQLRSKHAEKSAAL